MNLSNFKHDDRTLTFLWCQKELCKVNEEQSKRKILILENRRFPVLPSLAV